MTMLMTILFITRDRPGSQQVTPNPEKSHLLILPTGTHLPFKERRESKVPKVFKDPKDRKGL